MTFCHCMSHIKEPIKFENDPFPKYSDMDITYIRLVDEDGKPLSFK